MNSAWVSGVGVFGKGLALAELPVARNPASIEIKPTTTIIAKMAIGLTTPFSVAANAVASPLRATQMQLLTRPFPNTGSRPAASCLDARAETCEDPHMAPYS